MLDYIVGPLFARGTTDQTVVEGYIAGDLGAYGVKFPWTDQGIDLVLGFQYRDENLNFDPDDGFRNGDGAGQGGATGPVDGGYDLNEYFIELGLPIIEGAPGAEELIFNFAYRYSDYSTGVTADSYGARVGWAIAPAFKLRGSYQRATRAANVQELFLPQGLNLFDLPADPCGGPVGANGLTAEGRSFDECARSGVTMAQFGLVPNNDAGQYNFLQGGNPDLEPEQADTYSAGFIWSPQFADLNLSIDYYDIEIKDGIDNLTPEFILNECLDGNLTQCPFVRRSAGRGDLWIGSDVQNSGQVVALQNNFAIERVKGWDVILDYTLEIGNTGSLRFDNVMSIIDTWDQQELAGAPKIDCNGFWGASCGYPTPEFRNNLRTTWITPWNVTASLMWRYIDKVEDLNIDEIDLGSRNYFDLAGYWNINNYVQVRLGVNNLLDEAPPIAGAAAGPSVQGNGNIFPGMYDFLGRYWFLGVRFGT